jgi:hypothetical protein
MRTRVMKLNAGASALRLALLADVTVVLLVDPLELGQLAVAGRERAGAEVLQALGDRAAQVAQRGFDVLVGDGLWFSFGQLKRRAKIFI